MKTAIIILMVLSAFNINVKYTKGFRQEQVELHIIPVIIALILFCCNY